MVNAPLKLLLVVLIIILAALQYTLWLSPHGLHEYLALRKEIKLAQQKNTLLDQRNQRLLAEIHDLKNGKESMEEHARNDLGMVKSDEMFYQIVPSTKK